ncbi:MAG: hypothetical protein ABIQ30_14420 [Devosia sp.]
MTDAQQFDLNIDGGSARFDGIGVVNGGGATSVLLKDYPEPQRGQILDMVYRPKFGASVSALLVEIPGDGNSTQGTMPSHMHTRDDLNYERGYIWWVLTEAKKRNPALTLDAVAWSAPGWVGDGEFWSQDTADYYVTWLEGLRDKYGLDLDAIGCRNEKGVSFEFARILRATLNARGFGHVALHAFDNWPHDKLDFVPALAADPQTRAAVDIIGAHVMYGETGYPTAEQRNLVREMGKPLWNTEDHVYKDGFDCLISIVECFNKNYVLGGATKVILWYDIAGIYPLEPYSKLPPMVLAHSPWDGHYQVREALWGYAHYGQFTEAGWHYSDAGCSILKDGGSIVTLVSPEGEVSIIIETKGASAVQLIDISLRPEWFQRSFCIWHSGAEAQFVEGQRLTSIDGVISLILQPDTVYSLSTTTGQQKGTFNDIPQPTPFPLPYAEDFTRYSAPRDHSYLPRYMADIGGVFELSARPGGEGVCLRQVVATPPLSWAPEWYPYSIFGDKDWQDVETSVTTFLNKGDVAGIMGRINHVGTGYGYVPQCYYFCVSAAGDAELVLVMGKENRAEMVGDAEQQALIQAQADKRTGGERVLAKARIPQVASGQWHRLSIAFNGANITCRVDGTTIFEVIDRTYSSGMSGLIAKRNGAEFSTPFFDEIAVSPAGVDVEFVEAVPTLVGVE